jgi:hypothetical protein
MSACSGQNPVFVNGFVVPVGQWTGDWVAVLADVTTSGTRGTRYVPVITDCSWSITMPHDDPFFAEAIGLGTGAIIAVMHFRHTQTRGDKLENTTVERVQRVSDAKDVVRVTVSGKGGALSNDVLVPDTTIFPSV